MLTMIIISTQESCKSLIYVSMLAGLVTVITPPTFAANAIVGGGFGVNYHLPTSHTSYGSRDQNNLKTIVYRLNRM